MELELFVRKVLLENAIKYEGSCNPKAAIGAVMREFPDLRGDAKRVSTVSAAVAKEINALSVKEQQELLDSLGGSDAPEKEEQDPFELDHKNPVLRFEPSPSGPLHIGHAYTLGLNHLLAVRNDGKLILRVADTNPENIYLPAYDLLVEDATWYTHDNVSEVAIQSDRMELYYSFAEKMLAEGWAYVCTCAAEDFRSLSMEKQACPCRGLSPAIALERWELMKTSYQPRDAVVRVKTDIAHKNPAMRDWPALRINTSEHPRTKHKYRVWPLMNFSVSIDDMEMGVTHVLRAKDHADNAKRQEYVYNYFGHTPPVVYNVGRINFTDLRLSTTKTRKLIEEGAYSGWDDVRLPFFAALRRRGFTAEALLRQAQEMGISAADKTLSQQEYFTNIESFNRELIDADADRAFFVARPKKIVVEHAVNVVVEKDLHPDTRPGGRRYDLGGEVFVDADDLKEPKGVLFRFMDGYNFRYENGGFVYAGDSLEEFKAAKNKRMLHFLPAQMPNSSCRVLLPDGSVVEGVFEARVDNYDVGSVLQFERFGFVKKIGERTFCFAHR